MATQEQGEKKLKTKTAAKAKTAAAKKKSAEKKKAAAAKAKIAAKKKTVSAKESAKKKAASAKARVAAAKKAAAARHAKARAANPDFVSQKEQKRRASLIPTSELTVEHYRDRPNPELSWAAAILKRGKSTPRQRAKAAEIMSQSGSPKSGAKISAYWKAMTPEERRELAARGGRRRWEIWRAEQARLRGGNPRKPNEAE